jgi:AcrR family transcriptional regulator
MSAEDAIIAGFRELIKTQGFCKTTVLDICQTAKVSRKTFYAHFLDKDDLLEKLMYRDLIQPVSDIRRLLDTEHFKSAARLIPEMMHRSIYSNGELYSKLASRSSLSQFTDTGIRIISKYNRDLLTKRGLPAQELDYMAYFYASSHMMLIVKWVKDGMRLPPEELARYFDKWALSSWGALDKDRPDWQANKPGR